MRTIITSLIASVICGTAGTAAPVPALDLHDLIADADAIVLGTVNTVRFQGATSVATPNGAVAADDFLATFVVHEVLKGPAASVLEVRFALPESTLSYRAVSAGDYGIAFLKVNGGQNQFASPYHPVIAAALEVRGRGNEPEERVLTFLAEVLRSSTDAALVERTMINLWGIQHPSVVDALQTRLSDSDEAIRLSAASALLRADQESGLAVAEAALQSEADIDPVLILNLRAAISGLLNEEAIPGLDRLLESTDALTRRAAAAALEDMGSRSARALLISALDDEDLEVRLHAVRGLARQSGMPELIPAKDEFRRNEDRYVVPLRTWALTVDR